MNKIQCAAVGCQKTANFIYPHLQEDPNKNLVLVPLCFIHCILYHIQKWIDGDDRLHQAKKELK